MMLTEVSPRVMPAPTGATTDLDNAILAVLEDRAPREPREIFQLLSDDAAGATLQKVHARLRVLVSRGVVVRSATENGPRRGPGAGLYHLA